MTATQQDKEKEIENFKLVKQSDDPMGVIRISCGYHEATDTGYIVYRGNLQKMKEALKKLLRQVEDQTMEGLPDPRGTTIPDTKLV